MSCSFETKLCFCNGPYNSNDDDDYNNNNDNNNNNKLMGEEIPFSA